MKTETRIDTLADVGGEPARARAITARAVIIGLILSAVVDVWIQYAELIMAGFQGHSALVNTSVPVGPITVLFVLAGVNIALQHIAPSLKLGKAELLCIYAMMCTSCVLSSSGQIQFLLPTIAAAWHYATAYNGWDSLFLPYIPHWLAQTNKEVLNGYYVGKTHVPFMQWLPQVAVWSGFLIALSVASLCTMAILRRHWVDAEKLTFPTVAVPLALMEEGTPILRNKIFWGGFLIPFGVCTINTFALAYPSIPLINLRTNFDVSTALTTPPWNTIGWTPVSFYPFVIGIGYFISLDVSFSSWFFFLITRLENVVGSTLGQTATVATANHASFPFFGEQGAGAFIAITALSLYSARHYLASVFKKAIGRNNHIDDSDEPLSYRTAFATLAICLIAMIVFCVIAGMNPVIAAVAIILGLVNFIAATRIRAETGDAWLFGPNTDPIALMEHTGGSSMFNVHDLTALAYLRPVISNFDLRCITMPHQLEAFKMADAAGVSRRSLTKAILVALVIGVFVAFWVALGFWHAYGAEGKTDPWRTSQGVVPFTNLADMLKHRSTPDIPGLEATGIGFIITAALFALRTRFVWWPFHPIGYAMANSLTMSSIWMPMFLAWMFKALVLKYGGAKVYRSMQPFFIGLILGDLLGGGFYTALGAFTGINVYPMNW